MFKRKKQREEIMKIAQEAQTKVEQIQRNAVERCDRADRAVEDMEMKMRQYDALMEMDYGDNYIDPVTGCVDPYKKFERNRDIYMEHLKDTGSLFDTE